MEKDLLNNVLSHFRSYRYAARMGVEFLDGAPNVYNERRQNPNRWDATRYSRIVNAVSGAIDEVLTDEQADIIRYKYMEKNPKSFEEIAETMEREIKTVRKRYNEAMQSLGIALSTFDDDAEITPFEHMFNDIN